MQDLPNSEVSFKIYLEMVSIKRFADVLLALHRCNLTLRLWFCNTLNLTLERLAPDQKI